MPTATAPEAKVQIGHVLFIDIVGYSKLLVHDQAAAIRQLNEVVQATDEFRNASRRSKLIRIPTGDGMALVFRDSPESPVRCAIAISSGLRKQSSPLRIRQGVHSGLVHGVADVNNRLNIAGAGINIAQRVMDCGDSGHILLSKHVAEDLEHHARWRPLLHDLGECEVKHGVRVGIVNLYDDDAGNPDLPQVIRRSRKKRRTSSAFLFAVTGAVSVLVAWGSWFASTRYSKPDSSTQAQPNDSPTALEASQSPATESDSPAIGPAGATFTHASQNAASWLSPLDSSMPANEERLFAGTWRGTVRSSGPKGTSSSQLELSIDGSERNWSNMAAGKVSRRGRTLTYARSYRLGGTNVRQTAELTVNGDGKTASYRTTLTSITRKVRSTTSGFGTLEKVE